MFEVLIKDEDALPTTIESLAAAEKDDYITKDFLEGVVNGFRKQKLYTRSEKKRRVDMGIINFLTGGKFVIGKLEPPRQVKLTCSKCGRKQYIYSKAQHLFRDI